jgi:hypothetical protein
LGTDFLRLGVKVLYLLKSMAALHAAIRIQRQGLNPLGEQTFFSFILPGRRRGSVILAALTECRR